MLLIKSKRIRKAFILIITLLSGICSNITAHASNNVGQCIAASDFGLGTTLYIDANPDANNNNPAQTRLIRAEPKKSQIAPWIDSGLYTAGVSDQQQGVHNNTLRGVVIGNWNPWGMGDKSDTPTCQYIPCDASLSKHVVCLNDGIIVDDSIDKVPCIVDNGYGLYGLIAILRDGSYLDPNEPYNAATLPPTHFRTFHVGPLKQGTTISKPTEENPDAPIEYEYYFEIDHTQQCDDQSVCRVDLDPAGNEHIARGRLFFKILDRYYQDNTGGYSVNVISGVYTDKGFIESTVQMFEDKIKIVQKKLYSSVTTNTKLFYIIQAMLILYIAGTALGFMLGVIKINQTELVIRLFKVGLITALFSETSWDFFNTHLYLLFTDGAKEVGQMIIRASLYFDGDPNMPLYPLPENASPLAVYDTLLKMLTMPPVHIKTVALLFYDWKLYWIPCIYICIVFILIAILKSVMIYVLMLIQIALLLVIAPIFIAMILFKITSELFDTWLKQLISAAMLYILLTATIALMMKLVVNQLTQLLHYKVCWQTVWNLTILGFTIIDLKFWYPQSVPEVLNAVNPIHFFAFLLICFLFKAFIEQLPSFVDILSNAVRTPVSSMYRIAAYRFEQTTIASVPSYLRALNPIGLLIDRKGSLTRKGLNLVDMGSAMVDKADRVLRPQDSEQSVKTQLIGDYRSWLPNESTSKGDYLSKPDVDAPEQSSEARADDTATDPKNTSRDLDSSTSSSWPFSSDAEGHDIENSSNVRGSARRLSDNDDQRSRE